MNKNSIKVENVHKNKARKNKKSKSSKNELLHLSVKSSKTLLKAMQVAKEEANYIKKYYQFNLNDEPIENEEGIRHPPISLSHYQQQFLQALLKQNHKNHERYPNNNLYSNSNLYPSMNIPSYPNYQSLHSSYPSYITNSIENNINNDYNKYDNNNFNNINFKNEATFYPKNNISTSVSSYTINNNNNTKVFPNNYHPLSQQCQNKLSLSSNINNNHISNNNIKKTVSINNNNSQYKTQNISMSAGNVSNKDKTFVKTNNWNKTLNNNNNNNVNIESHNLSNKDVMNVKPEHNISDNKEDINLEKLLKIQTKQYEELKKLKNYILSDSKKDSSTRKSQENEMGCDYEELSNYLSEKNFTEPSTINYYNDELNKEKSESNIQGYYIDEEYEKENSSMLNETQKYSYNNSRDNIKSSLNNNNKNNKNSGVKPKFQLDLKQEKTFKSRSGLLSKHTIKNDIMKKDDELRRSDEHLKKLTRKVPICVPNYKPKINTYRPHKLISNKKKSIKDNNDFSRENQEDMDDIPIKLNEISEAQEEDGKFKKENNEKDIKKVVEEAIKEILSKELLKSTFNDNPLNSIQKSIPYSNNNTNKNDEIKTISDKVQTGFQNRNQNSLIPHINMDDSLNLTGLENINNNLDTTFENIEDISEIINNKDIDFTIDEENISENLSKKIQNYHENQTEINEKEKQHSNSLVITLPGIPNSDDTTTNLNTITDDHFISKMENIIISNDHRSHDKSINKNSDKDENTNIIDSKKKIDKNKEKITAKNNNNETQSTERESSQKDNKSDKNISQSNNNSMTADLNVTKKDNLTIQHANMNWKTMKKEIQQEIDMKLKENKKLKKKGKNKRLERSFIDMSGQSSTKSTTSSTTTSPKISKTDLKSRHKTLSKSINKKKKEREKTIKPHREIGNHDDESSLGSDSSLSQSSMSEQSLNEDETHSDSSISTNTSLDHDTSLNQSDDSISYFFYNPNLKVKRVISNPMVRSFINSKNNKSEKACDKINKEKEKTKQDTIEPVDPEKQISVIKISSLMKKNIMQGRERFLNYLNENSLNGFGCGTFPDDLKAEDNVIDSEIYSVFNPWEIIESISDIILEEILEENTEEINNNLDQFIEDLFNEEFNPTNE